CLHPPPPNPCPFRQRKYLPNPEPHLPKTMGIEERVGQRVERRALGHRRARGARQFEHARKIIQRWLKACECQVSPAAFLVEIQVSLGLLLTGKLLDETERVAIVPLRLGVGV